MKKMVLLATASFASFCAYADTASFLTASPPQQAYHALSSTPTSQPAPTPATQTQSSPTADPAALIQSSTADVNLATSISQLTQTTSAFQQQAQQQIQNLDASNKVMGSAIQSINQDITVLQQQVSQLESTAGNAASKKTNWLDYVGIGGAGVFILSFGVFLGRLVRRRSTTSSIHQVQLNDTKSEYNFMETAEAIPAKLDLARSYLAMGNHEEALTVLKTVLKKGNPQQLAEAEKLIQQMNASTVA